MSERGMLTREDILNKLADTLNPLNYVYAMWEGGAAAFNRIDKWSDLDVCLVVDDSKTDETFVAVENALKSLSPISQKLEIPQLPWPGVSQAFYKLKKASAYHLIDLAIFKDSSPEKLLEEEIHGRAVFYFNKSGRIKVPRLKKTAFNKKLKERLERLQVRFDIFNIFVQKEINRGNYLEAIDLYHNFTLSSLVEALRIEHNPVHYEFKLRYVHSELPPHIISKLNFLYFVKDEKDLPRKYSEASKMFHETLSRLR